MVVARHHFNIRRACTYFIVSWPHDPTSPFADLVNNVNLIVFFFSWSWTTSWPVPTHTYCRRCSTWCRLHIVSSACSIRVAICCSSTRCCTRPYTLGTARTHHQRNSCPNLLTQFKHWWCSDQLGLFRSKILFIVMHFHIIYPLVFFSINDSEACTIIFSWWDVTLVCQQDLALSRLYTLLSL